VHRETIKRAASELFSSLSYSKTSVYDIAQAAGLGKGTIYLYFSSKDEILWSLMDDRVNTLTAVLKERVENTTIPFSEKLQEFTDTLVDEYLALKKLLFGNFDKVEGRMLRDVFIKFGTYQVWMRDLVTRIARVHGLGSELKPEELDARTDEVVELIVGHVVLFTMRNDWNENEKLKENLGPLLERLFRHYVLRT